MTVCYTSFDVLLSILPLTGACVILCMCEAGRIITTGLFILSSRKRVRIRTRKSPIPQSPWGISHNHEHNTNTRTIHLTPPLGTQHKCHKSQTLLLLLIQFSFWSVSIFLFLFSVPISSSSVHLALPCLRGPPFLPCPSTPNTIYTHVILSSPHLPAFCHVLSVFLLVSMLYSSFFLLLYSVFGIYLQPFRCEFFF